MRGAVPLAIAFRAVFCRVMVRNVFLAVPLEFACGNVFICGVVMPGLQQVRFLMFSGYLCLFSRGVHEYTTFSFSEAGVALHSLPSALKQTRGARLVPPLPLPHVREQLRERER